MLIEIVTFDIPETMSRAEVMAAYDGVTAKWRGVPELVRKSFIYDEARRIGGAVYQWRDAEAAARWHGPDWQAGVRATYGSEARIERFEMPMIADNELGRTEHYPAG